MLEDICSLFDDRLRPSWKRNGVPAGCTTSSPRCSPNESDRASENGADDRLVASSQYSVAGVRVSRGSTEDRSAKYTAQESKRDALHEASATSASYLQ